MPENPSDVSSASASGEERVRVRASAGVRTDSGLHFGTLVWVQGQRALFQLEQTLEASTLVDMRIDLSPAPGTALVRALVVREVARTATEIPSYLLRILTVADADKDRWAAWLQAKRTGGTLQSVSDMRLGGSPLDAGYGNVASSERNAALDRMSGRMGLSSTSTGPSSWTASDLREAATGRAAMRDALKAAIRKASDGPLPPSQTGGPAPSPYAASRPGGSPPPPQPPIPSAGARPVSVGPADPFAPQQRAPSVGPADRPARPPSNPPVITQRPPSVAPIDRCASPGRRATPSAAATPARPPTPAPTGPPADPAWTAQEVAGRSYVEVRWLDPEALSYDVHTQLAGGALTLHAGGRRLPSLPPIHMLLRHDPVFIQCEASPVDMKATSATYRLNLNGSQVAELRKFARPLSNEISVSVEQKRRR